MGYVSVEAIGSGDDAGYRRYDAVKARGGIITEFDVRMAGRKCVVHLEFLNDKGIMGHAGGLTAVATGVEEVIVFTVMHQSAKLNAKE
jgi:hypothetical protein